MNLRSLLVVGILLLASAFSSSALTLGSKGSKCKAGETEVANPMAICKAGTRNCLMMCVPKSKQVPKR